MLDNYIKIALRNIKRYSTYSILNITGMAIGMACAILILLWVQDEYSYDRHFKNADNLYRLIEKNPTGDGTMMAPTAGALPRILKEEYPEIIRSTRYGAPPGFILQKGDEFLGEQIAMADKDFLKMFDIEFLKGDFNSALNEPHNILITEKMVHKYYGNDDPLGKVLTAVGGKVVFTITGVIKSLPPNSHIHFDMLFPIDWDGTPSIDDDWNWRQNNYIELKEGTDSKLFEEKIKHILKKHYENSNSEIILQNIKKIHLFSSGKYIFDISGHGDITYVRIFSLIAIFILLIACINFMNLSTAQSAMRAREIGIRKVAGANKRKIVFQFLGESLLIVIVAHVLAMILVELFLPGYNNLTGKQLYVNYHSIGLYAGLISIVLFCGFLAGSYPAFYLSSLKPLDTMKGLIIKNSGIPQFRRALVIFQFSLSVILIICTLVVRNQLHYIQNKSLGFNKDDIGYFNYPAAPWDPVLKTVKNEFSKNPDLISITAGPMNPFNSDNTMSGLNWQGKRDGDDIMFYGLYADVDFAKTFKLELKDGRFFSSEFASDSSAIVINEEAEKVLGFKNPIGEIISTGSGLKLNIIGVVKDFHFKSLHHKIGPVIMGIGTSNFFYVKMRHNNISSTIKSIGKTYDSFKPILPLDFHFLNDDFDNMYQTERRIGKIFKWFSFLAIIISCLGLIGLSSFMTERRTKEIGIRKMNGARSIEIFSMLSREFISWVCISIIIAIPISWFIMNKWLQNFAYRINISWWVFVSAGLGALLIAFLTVSIQSYRAAGKNPVEALRYE
jgi:putative ABC transport system permease protein